VNPLNEYPTIRRYAYLFQWVVNLALGILGIVFLNIYTQMPEWFLITGLVFNFLWSYTGLTAQQNVPSYRDVVEGDAPPPDLEDGTASWFPVVVVLLLLGILLVLVGVNVDIGR
jgi:hypothetical protein